METTFETMDCKTYLTNMIPKFKEEAQKLLMRNEFQWAWIVYVTLGISDKLEDAIFRYSCNGELQYVEDEAKRVVRAYNDEYKQDATVRTWLD